MDLAYALLFSAIEHADANDLLIADENFPLTETHKLNNRNLQCLSNRFDIAEHLASISENHAFNDFDFNNLKYSPNKIFYRVSKEKAVTHYVINESLRVLPEAGKLFLAGYKNDGIKTYTDKSKKLFGGELELINGDKSAKLAILTKKNSYTDAARLDDKDYRTLREITTIDDIPILSKPGVFGWNKTDPGSTFLVAHLPELLNKLAHHPLQVLDLGCGYGYIAIQAFHQNEALKECHFVLTDNNAAAITCAQQNIVLHKLNASVAADDCGKHLSETFDLILCNPPFHKGFDVSNDISTHFINNIHSLMNKNGTALLVVNQFVGIEKRAMGKFAAIYELARNKSFKLIVLSAPK
ncbi:MAG: methyltransferase [Pseudomonadales bacterium]|nr:methyltransferase [Pseudomonadales bacterium]